MQSFDRLRMKGKRLRMKVLVDEGRLEDQDAIALGKACRQHASGIVHRLEWPYRTQREVSTCGNI